MDNFEVEKRFLEEQMNEYKRIKLERYEEIFVLRKTLLGKERDFENFTFDNFIELKFNRQIQR